MRAGPSPKPNSGKIVSATWMISQAATMYAAAIRMTFRRLSSSKNDIALIRALSNDWPIMAEEASFVDYARMRCE